MDADERKEALRKKGQEFLEKAISQASTKSAKGTLGDVKVVHQRDSISPPLDPALETVGVVVEGLKDYIAALVFVISSAASLVLAKVRVLTIIPLHAHTRHPGHTDLPQHPRHGCLLPHAHCCGGAIVHVCHGGVYTRSIFVGIAPSVQCRGHLLRPPGTF